VDSKGKVTNIKLNGTVLEDSPGVPQTATIFVAGTNLYSFVASDGTRAGFYADAGATHAAFLDEFGEVGVLQHGAALPLPACAGADIAGSWTGYTVDLDANLNVSRTFNSSATVTNTTNFPFTGTDAVAGAFSGTLPTVDTTFGRWVGTFTQTPVTGTVRAFMA